MHGSRRVSLKRSADLGDASKHRVFCRQFGKCREFGSYVHVKYKFFRNLQTVSSLHCLSAVPEIEDDIKD